MQEIKVKSFHSISLLFLFQLKMLTIYWEDLQGKISEFFNQTRSLSIVSIKCQPLETSSQLYIILKGFMFLEDMMDKVKYS